MDIFPGAHFLPTHVARAMQAPTAVPARRAMAPAAVTNWTVTAPGTTKAPTTDDYDQWNVDQLRKECTARGKKIKRNIEDEGGVRRRALRESDLARQRRVPVVAGTSGGVDGTELQRRSAGQSACARRHGSDGSSSKVCTPERDGSVRVVHVVSPEDVEGKVVPRANVPMRRPTTTHEAATWKRNREGHCFAGFGVGMSKVPAPSAFPPRKPTEAVPVTPPGPKVRTVPASLPLQTRGVSEILDCLSKTYNIWIQLQSAVDGMKGQGHHVPKLQQSTELMEAGLRVLEQEYAAALGLDPAKKKARTGRVADSIQ